MSCIQTTAKGLFLSALLTLSACGGGGGGDSPSSQQPPAAPVPAPAVPVLPPEVTTPGVTVTTDRDELRFITLNYNGDNEAQITFTLAGSLSGGTYFAKAEPDAPADFYTYIAGNNMTSIRVGVRARNPAPIGDGLIKFKLCRDERCDDVVWSRSIPYRIRRFMFDGNAITLSGFEGATTSVTRAITPIPAAGELEFFVSPSPWLSASLDAAGRLNVTGSGVNLSNGHYNGTVSIRAGKIGNYNLFQVPVSMSVGTGVILPPEATVTIDNRTPALINGSMSLGFSGQQAPAWTVSSDKPWLVARTATGTGAGAVAYSIDATKLAGMVNFGANTGTLTFKIAGHSDATYKVIVDKKVTEIEAISPAIVRAGVTTEVRLRGRELKQLASIGAITLNGTPLSTGTILSDTEATVTLGGLTAGTYALAIPSLPGSVQSSITVVNAPKLAAAMIDSATAKGELIYSATLSAMYVVDQTNAKLLRYSLAGGTWINDKSIPIDSNTRLGLSHDEKTLYTTNGYTTDGYTTSVYSILEERDPATLAVRTSHVFPGDYLGDFHHKALPITNDGRIWFARGQSSDLFYFDTKTKTFGNGDIPNQLGPNSPVFAVSRDGSMMFVYSQTSTSNQGLRYNLTKRAFELTPSQPYFAMWDAALSANGKVILIGGSKMYETDTYRLIGQVPGSAGGYTLKALVSPDGSRIYVPVSKVDGNSVSSVPSMDVIDSVTMKKVGEIALPAGTTQCDPDRSFCSTYSDVTLTAFGDAIILNGNSKIAVVPIPAAMSGHSALQRFKLLK